MAQPHVECLRTRVHRSPGGSVNLSRRGSAMVLVLIATASAFLVGMSFLSRATAVPVVSSRLADYAQARQIAESGLEMTLRALEADPGWYTKRSESEKWVSANPLLGGRFELRPHNFKRSKIVTQIDIDDPSFESQKRMLNQGVLGLVLAEMTRTIGGWRFHRTPFAGLLPPPMGTKQDNGAPDGNTVASITFSVALLGTGEVSRTLPTTSFLPNSEYVLKIDLKSSAVLDLLAIKPFVRLERVSGGVRHEVASASDARLLTLLSVSNHFRTLELRYQTDNTPPAGNIGIAFGAAALVSAVAELRFDNVRLEVETLRPPEPFWLEVDGHFGQASHRLWVKVGLRGNSLHILQWVESKPKELRS